MNRKPKPRDPNQDKNFINLLNYAAMLSRCFVHQLGRKQKMTDLYLKLTETVPFAVRAVYTAGIRLYSDHFLLCYYCRPEGRANARASN